MTAFLANTAPLAVKALATVSERILGVEGGGTKTAWVLVEHDGDSFRIIEQGKLPPSNLRLTSVERLSAIFGRCRPMRNRVGMFLAGCATEEDRKRLQSCAARSGRRRKLLPGAIAIQDWLRRLGRGDGIAVNAGTGASVTGRRGDRIEKAGGWGHILGDAGGGYFISLQALRFILREHDLHRGEAQFTATILARAEFEQSRRAGSLGPDRRQNGRRGPGAGRFRMRHERRRKRDENCRGSCRRPERIHRRRRHAARPSRTESDFARRALPARRRLRPRLQTPAEKVLSDARVSMSEQTPELGAAWLASQCRGDAPPCTSRAPRPKSEGLARALTEQRNPRSENLDKLSARELVELFVEEETFVQEALRKEAESLARADRNGDQVVARRRTFVLCRRRDQRAARAFSMRAKSRPRSARPPDQVQGIIAGGLTALSRSVEGAEDERGSGALAVDERGVQARTDLFAGLTASGRAPFVLGALAEAGKRGAQTILLTLQSGAERAEKAAILEIDLATGPELLTGSTRLKAGTATKIALNIISTGAMVALGKVRGNLMIDVTQFRIRSCAIAPSGSSRTRELRSRSEAIGWICTTGTFAPRWR